MIQSEEKYLGHLKYYGKLVDEGYLDTKKSAQVLLGFDEILRYFLYQEDKSLNVLEFEIPVRIQKGSWMAIIPENIGEWVRLAIGTGLTTYALAAAKKMADNDFKDIGLKTVFKSALKGIVWVIKIAVHLGSMAKKKIENVKFRNNNTEIGIVNDEGNILWVDKKHIDLYINCPDKLFLKITQIIEPERNMEIAMVEEPDQVSKITYTHRHIFCKSPEELDDLIFPELENGNYVELDGFVTRGNQNTNSIGFFYNGHILTCYPRDGSIIRFKQLLFTHCLIKGFVDRLDKNGILIEKKPRIIFIDLVLIDDEKTLELDFDNIDPEEK
jgi:hypothetical protein